MIKLIASDIDGTLVRESAHEIDPAYYEVIRELKAAGIRFCACSGRHYCSMLRLFAPVAEEIFFIAGNGTLVRTRDSILNSWQIEPALYLPTIQKLRAIEGGEILVEGTDTCWIEGYETPVTRLMRDEYRYDVTNIDDLDALVSEELIKISLHHPQVETAAGGLLHSDLAEQLSMTISGAEWLDLTPKGSGKGEALALLRERLGVRIEETVYFGDNLNDLSAFREAGVAATVANARQEMHDAADIVAQSYLDLGVLHELRHILELSKRFQAEGMTGQ